MNLIFQAPQWLESMQIKQRAIWGFFFFKKLWGGQSSNWLQKFSSVQTWKQYSEVTEFKYFEGMSAWIRIWSLKFLLTFEQVSSSPNMKTILPSNRVLIFWSNEDLNQDRNILITKTCKQSDCQSTLQISEVTFSLDMEDVEVRNSTKRMTFSRAQLAYPACLYQTKPRPSLITMINGNRTP